MGVANIFLVFLDEKKDVIVDAAVKGAALAAAAAGGMVIAKKQDERIIQEEKKKSFEHGVRSGVKLAEDSYKETLVAPLLARVALVHYISRVDGIVTKSEKKEIESKTSYILENPDLPIELKKEIKTILSNKRIDWDLVVKYLDMTSDNSLVSLLGDMYDVANASGGINDEEQEAIEKIEEYVANRLNLTLVDNFDERNQLFKLVPESKIQNVVEEYSLKMKMLDYAFSKRTKLNKDEIGLLVLATALQCVRIYLVNYLSNVETAGKGKKEHFLHEQQKKIMKHFDNGIDEKARPYYAPLNQIISIKGVPYDVTNFELGKKTDIFSGANHRFSTLGHDPIFGLVIGTTNIMTNTITAMTEGFSVPVTYHVKYKETFKAPNISDNASLVYALKEVVSRSKDDIKPLAAALLKQLIHIGTDLYTKAGIQLPFSNLMLTNSNVEYLTRFVDSGDLIKLGTSSFIEQLINTLISLIHGCMTLGHENDWDENLHKVKTRKIIAYSNAMATGSNYVQSLVIGNYSNLDWAGVLSLVSNTFSDINFVFDMKREFISKGLGEIK